MQIVKKHYVEIGLLCDLAPPIECLTAIPLLLIQICNSLSEVTTTKTHYVITM